MPSLQDIESFKDILNEIGDEPAILEARGEAIEDISPPEAEDLSDLFDDEAGLTGMDLVDQAAPVVETAPSVVFSGEGEPGESDEGFDDLDDGLGDGFDDDFDIDGIFPSEAESDTGQRASPDDLAFDTSDTADDEVTSGFDDFSFPEDTQFGSTDTEDASIPDFDDAFFGEDPDHDTEEPSADAAPVEEPIFEEFSFEATASEESVSDDTESGLDDVAPLDELDFDLDEDMPTTSMDDEILFDDVRSDEGSEEGSDIGMPAEAFSFDQPLFGDTDEPSESASELDEFPRDVIVESEGNDDFTFDDGLDTEVDVEMADESEDVEAEDTFDISTDDFGDFDSFEMPDGFETETAEADEPSEPAEPQFSETAFTESADDFSFDLDDGIGDVSEGEDASVSEDYESPDTEVDEFSVPDEFSFDDETDTFDSASFESNEAADSEEAFSFDDGAPSYSPEEDADEVLEATDEDDFDLDDFSLGDIGEEFGLTEDEAESLPTEEELNPALAVSEELPETDEALDLTDSQFQSLQETLNSLPRNLRLIIEELIGEEQLAGDDLRKLVDALVRGRSPKEIGAVASAITGESIAIPSQYEKRTGREFEEERGTFAYVFKNSVLPALRIVGIGVAALALVTFLGYRFVYRPVRATAFYRAGLSKLEDGSYIPANEDFLRGVDLWDRKVWYYRYATGFRERRREDLAAAKYDELLASFPADRRGTLEYANLETFDRARYEHSEQLLRRLIDREPHDYDALLLLGDTYTEWAREAPEKYESARYAYATLLEQYGNRDEIMLRMLRYFIRTDNRVEVDRLNSYFRDLEGAQIDPYIFAELGGYYIDRDELDDVKPILFRAMEKDRYIADIHYNLARYFRKVDDIAEETRALNNAYTLLQNDELLTVDEERMFIDTTARLGEVAYQNRQYLEAQSRFVDALDLYEDALDRGRLTREPMFGRIYAALGDVFYYVAGQSEPALYNYLEAERNDFVPPELRYKIGNIRYRSNEYDDALIKFYQAAGDYSDNVNLMYATANTLYERGNFATAQGYYLHILDELETSRRNIPVLRPEEREDHRALIENLMRTYNNLGATMFRLSEISGEESKRSRSLAYLTRASEFFDRMTRDRETLVRTESKNLSYLNTRSILYPTLDFDVEIYNEIPRDMSELSF